MRILVLEDDSELGSWIQSGLTDAGHVVDWLEDGRHALAAATTQEYDVVLLDRMTPGLDGLSVLKAMRAAKNNVPVLILSALGMWSAGFRGWMRAVTIIWPSRSPLRSYWRVLMHWADVLRRELRKLCRY
ncbi:response regulator [Aliamphritea spongicola]|nr:response regulator [Aliamphritea spongicola]